MSNNHEANTNEHEACLEDNEACTVRAIPCNRLETISYKGEDETTMRCGHYYRGRPYYCRECLAQMYVNSIDTCNVLADTLRNVATEHHHGGVTEDTINNITVGLESLGVDMTGAYGELNG